MKLLTITNLYPRPDRRQAGLFNAQLLRELASLLQAEAPAEAGGLEQVTLVPEWRLWRWPAIRRWHSPYDGGHAATYLPVFYLPLLGRNRSARTYGFTCHSLVARMRAADAILAVWLYPDGVAVVQAAQGTGRPVWILLLGSDVQHLQAPARRAQILDACRQAAGMLCVSSPLARALIDAGVPAELVHVVPNGVDPARFHFAPRDASRAQLAAAMPARVPAPAWRNPATRVVLFVGNLVAIKNPQLLLQALAALSNVPGFDAGSAHAVMLGAGPLQKTLDRLARKLGLADRVHMPGRQSHEDVATWMRAADCLCLCSRSEGMPNVILEALASGLPVVATDVGACRDMLQDEPAARVVVPGDVQGLAQALRELLTMPLDRSKMAARHGRRTWREQAAEILDWVRSAGETPS